VEGADKLKEGSKVTVASSNKHKSATTTSGGVTP